MAPTETRTVWVVDEVHRDSQGFETVAETSEPFPSEDEAERYEYILNLFHATLWRGWRVREVTA